MGGVQGADDAALTGDGQRQQQQMDEQRRQQEEEMRARRLQQQHEELRRHQAALQQAAEARAAEETRQREALIASMSPQELARAAELHAQQSAVGSQVFGTQAAGHLADMVHQAHVRGLADGAADAGERAEVDHLMSLSPEELARWDQDCQGMGGGGTPVAHPTCQGVHGNCGLMRCPTSRPLQWPQQRARPRRRVPLPRHPAPGGAALVATSVREWECYSFCLSLWPAPIHQRHSLRNGAPQVAPMHLAAVHWDTRGAAAHAPTCAFQMVLAANFLVRVEV